MADTNIIRLPRPHKLQMLTRHVLKRPLWFLHPLPDAIVIGTGRAGSTAMYGYMLQHPDIRGPRLKEVHYLDMQWERGERWYRSQFPIMMGKRTWLAAEATPAYLSFPPAPERMRETAPNAKFLVSLRDPVGRAVSNWKFRSQRGVEKRSLDQLITDELDGTVEFRHQILIHGHYAEHLERWFAIFDRSQFHIVDAADLFNDAAGTMNEIFDFLGVDHYPATEVTIKNANSSPLKPSEDALTALAEYYEPHDKQLVDLLGYQLSWTS